MSALTVVLVTVLLIILSAFFVIIEFALLGARRHRLETDAPSSRSARAALRSINELTIMLAGAQLGITACTFALGAVTKPAADRWIGSLLVDLGAPGWLAGGTSFALSLLLVTFLHLVVGEMAPKSWAIAHPERAATLVALPGRVYIAVVRPLLVGINSLANRLVAASGVTPVDRAAVGGQDAETIAHLVEQSAAKGALDSRFQSQISQVLDLERLTVADLVQEGVVPAGVGTDATVADVQEVAARSGHKRILVTAPDSGVTGLVHVRDTLTESPARPVSELARPAFVLPPDTPVYEALRRMREHAEQLAVVAGGAGGQPAGVVGIVGMSDILHRVLPQPQTR